MKTPLQCLLSSLLIMFLFLPLTVLGQTAPLDYYIQTYQLDSDYHDGNGESGTNPELAFSAVVEIHNIPWLQLHFADANLGRESYIIITSLHDGYWQKLDATSIRQWNYYSAFFNGSAVKLELFVAPLDRRIFVNVNEVVAGEWSNGIPPESQCGATDDRVLSNQPATSRVLSIGCTSWIIPNGKLVTAGHCLDGSGATVVEFNVPLSLPNGTLQHPGPEDQYSVNVSTKIFVNGGIGNDWGVFEVYPNSVTGLMPKQAQSAFWPLAQDLGPDSIRITGYGVDYNDPTYTQVQQTNVGPNAGSSGSTMRYVTDTEGGNSGSPVIDALNNIAVGVHTHGGCTSTGGNNNGTSTFLATFWAAVDEGQGGCNVALPSNPNPPNGQTGVPLTLTELTWTNGTGANSNELYFGTSPSTLSLVQSGTLANSWTITGVTFTYGTTYYWKVVEIGDTCNTSGPVWSFTTVQDPNMVEWCDDFGDLSNWSWIGPFGQTNWSASSTNSAGGTPPEMYMNWSPSFTGVNTMRSVVIPGFPNNVSVDYSFKFYLDWYANPSGVVTVGVTYDGGATVNNLYTVSDPTASVGPILVSGNFTTPATGSENLQIEVTYNGYSFNINWISWDDMCLSYIVPVELTSFTAKTSDDEVNLSWKTATETNNQGFEIERVSLSATPGQEWEKIGFVPGFGTTTEPKSYTYVDSKLDAGKYSYRLKQIDFGGTYKYSEEVNVDVAVPLQYALEQNYPNPFNPSTKIKFILPSETKVRLTVYNALGQEVAEILNSTMKEGYHEVVFDAATLTSGIYFYRIEADKFVDVKKMIVIK